MPKLSWVQLGDYATILMGQSPPSTSVSDTAIAGSLPFLQGNAEFGSVYPVAKQYCVRPLRVCKTDDILLSVRAPVGETNVADRHYCIGRGLAAISITDLDIGYGRRVVEWAAPQLRNVAQGTTFDAVSRSDITSLTVPLPSLAEQRRIAEILDSVDEAIHATERAIAKLGHSMLALREWLIVGYHSGSGARDWTIGDVLTRTEYGISTPLTYEGGVPVLRMGNLAGGEIDTSDLKFTASPVPANLMLADGDVLFNRTNSMEHVGRTGIWRGSSGRLTFASYLVRLVPDEGLIPARLQS